MQGPDGPRKPVGTGPFTFVEWAQGDHIRVAKNKNYWQSGRPYVDEIVTTILRDPQAMVVSLESGALDLVLNPPVNDFVRLQKGGQVPDAAQSALRFVLCAGAQRDRPAA